ncbi:Beta-barrel assembly-enhancing protease [Achromobacter deleyi]|nr:Beta-barrel assembly-enhancing protease [Achromobacter deleyi]
MPVSSDPAQPGKAAQPEVAAAHRSAASGGGDIPGRLFAPGSAAHRAATLEWQSDGSLWLDDATTRQPLALRALHWSSRVGNAARRTTLPDGAVFETGDNDQVDLLEKALGRRRSALVHRLEYLRAPGLLVAVAITVIFLVSLRWAIPWAGDVAAQLVPRSAEAHIGASVMDSLDNLGLGPTQLPVATRQAIQTVFDDLAAQADVPGGSLRLAFRRGGRTIGANALALPGGQVIVTDQLVALAKTPEDLAGVLAHEIGHVQHRHGLRRLGRLAGLSAVALLVTGDISSLSHDIGLLGADLLDLSYSRNFEREADTSAVALMRKTHRDPAQLAVMLERLSQSTDQAGASHGWLSTHPSTEERIRLIREGP